MAITDQRYPPIRDYALVGDCHGSTLVSRTGSVDWCCLERFDADPVFCRILDADKGGFFSIAPESVTHVTRAYITGTNILRTTFSTDSGIVRVTDFLPVGRQPGAGVHDYVSLKAPCWLIRIAACVEGTVSLRVTYRPSVEFAGRPAQLSAAAHGVASDDGPFLQTALSLSVKGDLAEGTVTLRAGERCDFVVSPRPLLNPVSAASIDRLLATTSAYWEEWIAYCRYAGVYRDAVRGSHSDRARYTVEATAGLRALWTAFKQTGRVGRLWSSRASILRQPEQTA